MKNAVIINNPSLTIAIDFDYNKVIYDIKGGAKGYTYDVSRLPAVVQEFLKGKRGANACHRHASARKKRNFVASQFSHMLAVQQQAELHQRQLEKELQKEKEQSQIKENVEKFFLRPTLEHWDNMVPSVQAGILPLETPTGGWSAPLFMSESKTALNRLTACKKALDEKIKEYEKFAPVNLIQGNNNVGHTKAWLHNAEIRLLIPECLLDFDQTVERLEARISYLESLA